MMEYDIQHDLGPRHQSWPTYMDIPRVVQGLSGHIYQVLQLAHCQIRVHSGQSPDEIQLRTRTRGRQGLA